MNAPACPHCFQVHGAGCPVIKEAEKQIDAGNWYTMGEDGTFVHRRDTPRIEPEAPNTKRHGTQPAPISERREGVDQ